MREKEDDDIEEDGVFEVDIKEEDIVEEGVFVEDQNVDDREDEGADVEEWVLENCEELVAETVLEGAVIHEEELDDAQGVDALVELVIADEVWAEEEVDRAVDEGEVAEVDALVEVWVALVEAVEEAVGEEVWEAEVEELIIIDDEMEVESMEVDADVEAEVDKFSLAVLVSLPELEASEALDGVTLNCWDWARMPPPVVDTKLTW